MENEKKERDKKNREYYASLSMKDKAVYNRIENTTIEWVNDGHGTAGTLTRRIIKALKE